MERRLPESARSDHGRVRGPGTVVATPGIGIGDDRLRADPDHRLVPAMAEPLSRGPAVRRRRGAVCDRRRWSELQRHRLWPARRDQRHHHAQEPLRRPAGRRRGDDDAADSAGRRPPQPEPAATRRPTGRPQRDDHPRGPGHGRCDDHKPVSRERRSQCPSDRRLRHAKPVPICDQAWDERSVDRRCGLEYLGGDRSGPQPPCQHGRQFWMAVLRGRRSPGIVRARRPRFVLHPLREPDRSGQPLLHLQSRRPGRARRDVPDGQRLVNHRDGVLPGKRRQLWQHL